MPLKTLRKLSKFALSEDGSVKARVVRSGMWVGASHIVGSMLQLARSIVLARLLSPEIFGLMGLAGIAIRTINSVTRPGVAQALIARQQAFDEAAATAFTMLALRGVLLAGVLAIAAPWVAAFYDADVLAPMLTVLSAVFVIGGLSNINLIARQKELDFRRLTYLGLATNAVGTVVTIAVAFWLRSVWALVIGQLATTSVHSLLSYALIAGRPRFSWNAKIAQDLFRYGKFITGSSIVLFVAMEIDSAVIGKLLGVRELGFYTLAFTVANIATSNLSKLVSSIMMPAYSKLQADVTKLGNTFLRTLNLVMHVVLPASVGLMLMAEPIVRVIYGVKWLPAVVPIQILAVFGLFRALTSFNGYLFEGSGRPRIAFQLGMLRLAVIGPLIIPMVERYGLHGAAWTVTAGIAVHWLAGLGFLQKLYAIEMASVIRSMLRPLWTTIVMALVIVVLSRLVPNPDLLSLGAIVALGVVVYGGLNLKIIKDLRREAF